MRHVVARILAVSLALAFTDADCAPPDRTPFASWDRSNAGGGPGIKGWTLAFDDEFDSLDVGGFRWTGPGGPHHWYIRNGAASGAAVTPCAPGAQVSAGDGVARLTLAYRNGAWTTATLEALDPVQEGFKTFRGYFEARIKLPPNPPAGLDVWPAFWVQGRWTSPGADYSYTEVDGLEAWSLSHPTNQMTIHQWPAKSPHPDLPAHRQTSLKTSLNPFDGRWRTYGIKVTDREVCTYVDRTEAGCIPSARLDLRQPLYPIVDLALKQAAPEADKSATYTMYVDWVRVWTPPGG